MSQFENATLEEMYEMVANSNPTELCDRATALKQAAFDLDTLHTYIKRMISGVEWKGEGGDSFRHWSQQFVASTQQLSDYADKVGTAMGNAGQILHEVRQTVPSPPVGYGVWAPNTPMATKASADMQSGLKEAIPQMTKLSSAFQAATQDLKSAQGKAPTFTPLPSQMETGNWRGEDQTPIGATDPAQGVPPHQNGGFQPNGAAQAATVGGSPSDAHASGHGGQMVSAEPSKTSLDSAAPGTVAQHPQQVVAAPTPVKPHAHGPAQFVPGGVPLPPSLGQRGSSGSNRVPTEPIPATGSGPGTRNRIPQPAAGDEGIVGGMPSSSGRGLGPKALRGVVIGEEQPPAMRGPIGGGSYASSGGASSGVVGGVPARRLASEPGGEVSSPRSGAGSEGEYTPGGTGLRRSAPSTPEEGGGAGRSGYPMGPGVGSHPGAVHDGRGRRGTRPDYLVEDEETWATGCREVVPPVVD